MGSTSRIFPLALTALSAASLSSLSAPSALAQDSEGDVFCQDRWVAISRCRERAWPGPTLMFGLDLGASAMNESGPFGFDKGVGSVTEAGPAWGFRVGVELVPWLALEARYVGMYNSAQSSVSPVGSVAFATTGGEAIARLTAPLPYVRPYVFVGAGYYYMALSGSSAAEQATELHSSNQPGVPMGIGIDVPLSWHLSLGLEATYHYQIGEVYSSNTTNGMDGGDVTTFGLVVRARPY